MHEIRVLTDQEIKEVYHNQMKIDFPPSELKPLLTIRSLKKRGIYEGIGLFEDGSLCAYAFLTKELKTNWRLLDYFAVRAELRSKGYGSLFMHMLQTASGAGILLEAESVRSAQSDIEEEVRKRRIAFYEKNGMKKADFFVVLFGVEYEILCLPGEDKKQKIVRPGELEQIYQEIIPLILRKGNISFLPRNQTK